jgi:hypothetical protein
MSGKKMNRIEKNEQKLDNLNATVSSLILQLENFEKLIPEYHELNKYYGSKNWFKDKKDFENCKIKNVKAGVLSEDAVWNLDENISELIIKFEELSALIKKEKS